MGMAVIVGADVEESREAGRSWKECSLGLC